MFEDYATGMGAAYDEMYDDGAGLRTPYSQLQPSLQQMGQAELQTRVEALQSSYLDQGVTFDIGGEERAFPLDVLPRVIEMDQWAKVEAGVQQRVHTLEKFLDDVYDAGRVLDDGVVPRRVVTTSSHFHRAAAGIEPPNGVRVHVSGIDLIRDDDGEFRVLEDNVRVPSGVSYVMTNRRAIAAALPETFAEHRIRPVAGYPQKLLTALRAAAPAGVTDPNVVVLTPGVFNGAYFEHALLARTMGVELVEGRDLECRRGRVMMRTTQGLEPVHVIYRRVDDEFLDPVHFRSNSLLGCSGPDQRRPRRQRHDRQRRRQRRRRRQADLHLPARPGALLPRRGADPEERRHLAARRRRPPRGGDGPPRRAGASSRSTAPAARAS